MMQNSRRGSRRSFEPVLIGVAAVGMLLPGVPAAAQAAGGAAPPPKTGKPVSPNKAAMERGTDLFRNGDLDKALTAFLEAEKLDPTDGTPLAWLGLIHYRKNRYKEAIDCFQRSLKIKDSEPTTWNNLGNTHLAAGDFTKAIDAYRQAIQRQGTTRTLFDPFYNLGSALIKQGLYEDALSTLKDAEKLAPTDGAVQNNIGFIYEQMYLKEKDPAKRDPALLEQAVGYYQRAVNREPENQVFVRNLGLAKRRQDNRNAASITDLARATQLDGKDYGAWLALAEGYQANGQVADAIAAYQKAITVRPTEHVPHYNVGLMFARDKRVVEALASFQQAYRLAPTNADVLNALGYAYFLQSNWAESASWYQKAIQAKPDLQTAYSNLGRAQYRLGKKEEAATSWAKAVQLNPNDSDTRSLLATTYIEKGNATPVGRARDEWYRKGLAELDETVRINPKDAYAHNNRGFVLDRLRKPAESILAYRAAIEADPNIAIAHNNLGVALQAEGQIEQAKQSFQRAIQIDPNYKEARDNLRGLLNQ